MRKDHSASVRLDIAFPPCRDIHVSEIATKEITAVGALRPQLRPVILFRGREPAQISNDPLTRTYWAVRFDSSQRIIGVNPSILPPNDQRNRAAVDVDFKYHVFRRSSSRIGSPRPFHSSTLSPRGFYPFFHHEGHEEHEEIRELNV